MSECDVCLGRDGTPATVHATFDTSVNKPFTVAFCDSCLNAVVAVLDDIYLRSLMANNAEVEAAMQFFGVPMPTPPGCSADEHAERPASGEVLLPEADDWFPFCAECRDIMAAYEQRDFPSSSPESPGTHREQASDAHERGHQ